MHKLGEANRHLLNALPSIKRLKELDNAPSRASLAIDKACASAKEHKDEDALKILDEALKIDPASAGLLEAKSALEAVRKAQEIIEGIKSTEALALQRFKEATEIEDDETTRKMSKTASENLKRAAENQNRPLLEFAGRDFKAALAALVKAKKDAADLATELTKSSDYFLKLSEKADDKVGVKLPGFPKFGIGGDKKKADRYKLLVEGFKALASQCKEFQK